jgi:hypothetical protein
MISSKDENVLTISRASFAWMDGFAETQITEDIEYEVIRLIGHVQWLCPLALSWRMLLDQVQPSIDVGVDQRFSSTQSTVRESLV